MPDPMAWWSPIEDCAFLAVDYLTGQCNRYRRQGSEERRKEIRAWSPGCTNFRMSAGFPA